MKRHFQCPADPTMIRAWSENDPRMKPSVRNPPRNRGYLSRPPRAFCIEKYNISRSGYHSKFHRILRLPRKVTLELHQVLRLPRKVTLIIDPDPVIYNARSNQCHCPNSPNTAPATKNESHDWSLSLNYYLTELVSYDLTELLLDWAKTWLSFDLTELWLDWAMTWLSDYLTELLLDWAITWLSYYLTELWLDGAMMTWLGYYLTELWLDWAMTWLSYDLTELLLEWATSSTAQGGGGSFKNRKPIGKIGCCESRMAEQKHWWMELSNCVTD